MSGVRLVMALLVMPAMISVALAARAAEPCIAISGAKVWLPGGEAGDVTVVMAAGKVRAVGGEVDTTGGSAVDGRGMVLTAGFVDAFSGLGLVEVDLEDATVDVDLKNVLQDPQGAVRAAVRASLAYNARSISIPVARSGGVTSTLVAPSGGVISGGAFWVDLGGGTRAGILREPAAMIATLGGNESRAASLHVIDVALREARAWPQERAGYVRNQRSGFANKTLDLEALGPVIRGEVPLALRVQRASDIEAALAMTEGTAVRLVVIGGAEAWLVREALAARRVPVVLDALAFGPSSFDTLRARPDNAALLDEAGVAVALSVFDTHQVRKLRQVAGNAVREGMRWEAALLAVTERPADIFGMPRHGRIAADAVANVVLWSGDPFELATRVSRMWIGGREVDLRSRQTELFERWRKLP